MGLSLGPRWDFNPPPFVSWAQIYTYTGDAHNPASLELSGQGAPLYKSVYTNFAPRFGIAVTIRNQPGHELVFRGGGGLFYDTVALAQTFGAGYGLGTARTVNYNGTPQQSFIWEIKKT